MFDNDVAVLCISGTAYLLLLIVFYYKIKRMYAKVLARKVSQTEGGNLDIVVWNDTHGRTEYLSVDTCIPLEKSASVIRAVRMWGIVRRKSIIEIKDVNASKILYRTY